MLVYIYDYYLLIAIEIIFDFIQEKTSNYMVEMHIISRNRYEQHSVLKKARKKNIHDNSNTSKVK